MSEKLVLIGDRWSGVLDHDWTIDPATEASVDEALNNLDAKAFTMLTIQRGDGAHLVVGGGAGRYVVYASVARDEFWSLLRSDRADGIVLLNVGGQEGDFPAQQVVEIGQARAAAQSFLASCQLDSTQRWVKQ
jgi:hypothetical protein